MGTTAQKILGIVLLIGGLLIVGMALLCMYKVFTGIVNPPEIAALRKITLTYEKAGKMEVAIDKEMNRMVDIALWYVFMMFLSIVGAQVSGVGVNLMKEIKVNFKVRENQDPGS